MQDNPYGIHALWQQSDIVIKSVAIILLIMSIATWTVILIRAWRLARLRGRLHALNDFWHTHSFTEGLHLLGSGDYHNHFRRLAEEGQAALEHHRACKTDLHGSLPLSDWLTTCLRGTIDESAERLQKGLSILASVGATAPFIGLFGTVWGIYHALINIGASGQVGIDQIAGPVGEALVMTAFGLGVAIPAVLGYNALVRGNKAVLGKLNRFAQQLHAYFLTGAPFVCLLDNNNVRPLRMHQQEAS